MSAIKPSFEATVKPDECALITERFARRLAYPLARLALKLGMSANCVTLIAGLCWLTSVPLVVAGGYLLGQESVKAGWILWFICGCLWNAGYILDLADGSLARMSATASPSGFYLDYVFHLLFKPAFLASIGIALYLSRDGGIVFLILAVMAIPANWSASSSAAEHVICEETGKGRYKTGSSETGQIDSFLWLGVTDSHAPAVHKSSGFRLTMRVLAQEILSYYGQFTFFSLLVLLDMICAFVGVKVRLPFTSVAFVVLSLFLTLRIPLRVRRDFHRIREGMDDEAEKS